MASALAFLLSWANAPFAIAMITLGPALSGAMLDPPTSGVCGTSGTSATDVGSTEAERTNDPVSREVIALREAILGKLDAILDTLRTPRSSP